MGTEAFGWDVFPISPKPAAEFMAYFPSDLSWKKDALYLAGVAPSLLATIVGQNVNKLGPEMQASSAFVPHRVVDIQRYPHQARGRNRSFTVGVAGGPTSGCQAYHSTSLMLSAASPVAMRLGRDLGHGCYGFLRRSRRSLF